MKEYKFKNGMSTKVDDDTYDKMQGMKWNCNKDVHSSNWYVTKQRRIEREHGTVYRKFGLAEFIMGRPGDGVQIDHINRDSLDNRRSNLRFCKRGENLANRGKMRGCSSKYKGVCKRYNGYYAQIRANNVNHYLGKFDSEQEAALAYNSAALKFFGEYACLNLQDELF